MYWFDPYIETKKCKDLIRTLGQSVHKSHHGICKHPIIPPLVFIGYLFVYRFIKKYEKIPSKWNKGKQKL